MHPWARLAVSAVLACLVAACGAQPPGSPSPSIPSPTPTASAPVPLDTPAPCSGPLSILGAFADRMASDIAALRPLVDATTFDNGAVLTLIRDVSATLQTYEGLEPTLPPCDGSFRLSERLDKLRITAGAAVTAAVSVHVWDSKAQRKAALTLLALLPELKALSADAATVADALAPGVTQRTLDAYATSVLTTYRTDVGTSVQALLQIDCTGMTGAECEPLADAGASWVKVAVASINGHLAFMKEHPAASCFEDAYATDTDIANNLTSVLSDWFAGSSADTRAENQKVQAAYAAADSFVSRITSYFSDCR